MLKHIAVISLILISTASNAELYKYQDADGSWHFTDKVPDRNQVKAETFAYDHSSKESHNASDANIPDILSQHFLPKTPVEQASLAVVGIESKLGTGSGFFITTTGYIITNKHVIRPSPKTDETLNTLNSQKDRLNRWDASLKTKKTKLMKVEKELADYKAATGKGKPKITATDMADYEYRLSEYSEYKKHYDDEESRYNTDKAKVTKALREFNMMLNQAQLAKTFKIYTKDQKLYTARLVEVSDSFDLALLKIDVKITPTLASGISTSLSQGERVYAIGSPLGQSDSVTSGVITRVSKDTVITDTQILPGNSGGPLITENGQVIAVNTLKISQQKGSEGFGHSIPIETVQKEFKDWISP